MIRFITTFILGSMAFFSFLDNVNAQEDNRAQKIINKAIEAHGGDAYQNVAVAFNFRDKAYTIKLDGGNFEYSRSYTDGKGLIHDVLNNDGFTRTIDGKPITLSEKDKSKYSNSLNSVCYFTLLPNGLNDPAVKKSMIGLNKIDGHKYDVVHVGFEQEGGGDDFEDEYVYWVNKKTSTIDFFAYSYQVNGGGMRFRVAKDPIEIGGIRFQNYVNYKYEKDDATLDSLPFYYVQDKLTKLSEINNTDITIISPSSLSADQ